jgi:membrane protease YdiL (CAAX protease family)
MNEMNGTTEIPQPMGRQQPGGANEIPRSGAGTKQLSSTTEIPQYSVGKTLLVWAAAAVPMGLLGWVVAPALARGADQPGMVRLAVLTVGLIWQFVLVLILLYRETGSLRWSTIGPRLWLQQPRSPRTGAVDRRLWWWLIPLLLLTVVYELQITGIIERLWVTLFPALAEPPAFSMAGFLGTADGRAQLVGAWGFFALFLVNAVLNTVVGEELLFRGLLLPRMTGAFGRWSWVVNGLLFGLYHFHQPWGMAASAIEGMFLLAYASKRFQSAWFGIIIHSGQSVFFTIIILGLVLGLAH